MNNVMNMLKKSAMGFALVGLFAQPCQAAGLVDAGMKALVATLIAVSPKIHEGATTAYSTKYEREEMKKPEQEQDFDSIHARVPRKSIEAAIFAGITGLQLAALYLKRFSINNVAQIPMSKKLLVSHAFKCALPGVMALGSIYTSQGIYQKVLNGKYGQAALSLSLVAASIFAMSVIAEKLSDSGINDNIENTLKSWNTVKAQFLPNETLDVLAAKACGNQQLNSEELSVAQNALRQVGFEKTISGTVKK